MNVLLFEYLPSFTPVLVVGGVAHYMFKLLRLITEEAKGG